MKRAFWIGSFLLAITALGAQPSEVLQMANDAYRAEDFGKAIRLYEGILEKEYGSAALFYNLGNAYYRSGQLGQAIWNYEKGLLLAPRDQDLRHNLNIAKGEQADDLAGLRPFFLTRWWGWLRSWSSPAGWSVIALILVWLGAGGLAWWRLGRSRGQRVRGFAVGLACLVGSGTMLAFGWSARSWQQHSGFAVVLEKEVDLREAPDARSESVLPLHEGLKVKWLDQIGDWYKVQLSDGQIGWLPAQTMGLIGLAPASAR